MLLLRRTHSRHRLCLLILRDVLGVEVLFGHRSHEGKGAVLKPALGCRRVEARGGASGQKEEEGEKEDPRL